MKRRQIALLISNVTVGNVIEVLANLTNIFIDRLYQMVETGVSDAAKRQARRCLLDYVGVTIAGAHMLQGDKPNLLEDLDLVASEDAALIGFHRRASVADAVFVNGLSAHMAELDDGIRYGALHPGSPVISALMPVAEKYGVSGDKLLLGIVVGYEAAVRIATAMQPSHYSRSYHPSATCGGIGAAVGISAMLGYSREQMHNALSAAAVTASGMLKVIENGSELKPFNVARAAQAGLFAARMGKAGFQGLDDVLSGATGFLKMMTDSFDREPLQKECGDVLEVEKVYFKAYASCRHTHAPIEAVFKMRDEHSLEPEDVRKIKIRTYQGVLGKHDHTEIRGGASAKMSIPYSVAVALSTGAADLEQFSDAQASNPRILELTKKVEVFGEESLTALVPHQRVAIVEVETIDGTVFSERIEYPKGEPENPISDEELEDKFAALAYFGGRSENEVKKMIQSLSDLAENTENLFKNL